MASQSKDVQLSNPVAAKDVSNLGKDTSSASADGIVDIAGATMEQDPSVKRNAGW